MAIRAPAILKTEYEVFLSFRGSDTRQGFTDVLYNHLIESGIQVFRDDDELAIGDTIELILDAITNSKICVPIFSKSFASSAWCLREVAKMVELNKVIVPIFYDVIVDDVKLKTPLYVDHLKEHQQKYGKEQVVEWEKALVEVTRIKGRELKKDMGFVKFNKQFTGEILLKLGGKQKFTTYQFVEMTDQTEAAMDMLDIQSADVRSLGLYGMGGIGKTTLAKTIFNRISGSFDACSFLANIREECSTSKGLESLQTKLLQDLNSKADCADRMKSSLRMKRVLIVLDDVSEIRHIRELIGEPMSFGSGSRIIITTRDERVVKNFMQAFSSSDEGSTKVSPCVAKMEITGMNSKQAMQLFSGHAFGSNSPPQDYLSLSNEVISICAGLPLALEVIGSLLCGMSIQSWIAKISKLKKIPEEGVREKLMISYEALKNDEKEIFLDIACFFINEETSYPTYMWEACGFCPNWAVPVLLSMSLVKIRDDKFWMHDQLRDLGREIVSIKQHNSLSPREGIRIQSYNTLSALDRQQKKEVIGLRLDSSSASGTDLKPFENLRFLQVEQETEVRRFWQLPKNVRWLSIRLVDPNLIVAIRRKVSGLSRIQNNSYLMNLAVLTLKHSSISDNWDGWILIQKLQGLKALSLRGCKRLTRTPNFSKIVALEHLNLSDCIKLVKIHSSIGKLLKLKSLNLNECIHIRELPDSIGKLKNLNFLSLRFCIRLDKLPECIGDLGSLVHLDMSFSRKLKELPETIAQLSHLETLLSDYSHIERLPELPTSLTSLSLIRGCCSLKQSPNLSKLIQLKELSIDGALWPQLGIEPLEFDGLNSVPAECSTLPHLKTLTVICSNLKSSLQFPSSLQCLTLRDAKKETKLPCLSNLKNLTELCFEHCLMEEGLQDLGVERLGSLIKLKVNNCGTIDKFPDLSQLKCLEVLHVEFCGKLVGIPGLGKLISLKHLWFFNCNSLKSLENLKNLRRLKDVEILDCNNFRGIEGFQGPPDSEVYIRKTSLQDLNGMVWRWHGSIPSLLSVEAKERH